MHVPKQLRKKLEDKAKKGIFMGYGDTRSTYRVAVNGKVSVYRDVIFNENDVPRALLPAPKSVHFPNLPSLESEISGGDSKTEKGISCKERHEYENNEDQEDDFHDVDDG